VLDDAAELLNGEAGDNENMAVIVARNDDLRLIMTIMEWDV